MELQKSKKTAIVLGATGLVGRHLVAALLAHPAYTEVVCLVRRPMASPMASPMAKRKNVVIDFDRMHDFGNCFAGDDLFICLGTTRAKAGSDAAFRKVDYEYVVQAARLAADNNCKQCLLVSSVGADAQSSLLYPKTKGEAEDRVKTMPFWATHILQPSLLLGERDEVRIGESIFAVLLRAADALVGAGLGKYRPIAAAQVAKAIVRLAQGLQPGLFVHNSHQIITLSEAAE